jgi:hypothetical protein
MLDHDPHSYEQIAHAFEGRPEGGLTRDAILDNITLYWVTNTGTTAAGTRPAAEWVDEHLDRLRDTMHTY